MNMVLLKFEIVCYVCACVMDTKREQHTKYISYTIPCRDSIRFDSIRLAELCFTKIDVFDMIAQRDIVCVCVST